jgi:hypothetical protein
MQKDSLTSTCASDPDVRCDNIYRFNVSSKEPMIKGYAEKEKEKKSKAYVKVDSSLSPKLSPIDHPPIKSRH